MINQIGNSVKQTGHSRKPTHDSGKLKKSSDQKVLHSAATIRTYSPKEGLRNLLMSLIPVGLAVATEAQLAAYGLKEGGNKNPSVNASGDDGAGFNGFVGLLKTWMPFINEFLGVFNIWGKAIDMVAATAILWNTVDESEEYGPLSGFLKGVGLLIFSFFGPTWFIPRFQNFVAGALQQHHMFTAPKNDKQILGLGKIGRIAAGFAAVFILEACVKLWDVYIIPLFEEGVRKLKDKFMPTPTNTPKKELPPNTVQGVINRVLTDASAQNASKS
jgi:riboflavin transporter FmnP